MVPSTFDLDSFRFASKKNQDYVFDMLCCFKSLMVQKQDNGYITVAWPEDMVDMYSFIGNLILPETT